MEHGIINEVAICIVVAWLLAVAAQILRQPLILAYLAAGFAVGPIGIGLVKDLAANESISALGLILLRAKVKRLLDECIDRRLARELPGHFVRTVPQMGWATIKNGRLLLRAKPQSREGFLLHHLPSFAPWRLGARTADVQRDSSGASGGGLCYFH